MSVNKGLPHLLVLPEDDANRQVAKGFHGQVHWTRQGQMQVLPVAGGWNNVLNLFQSEHVSFMHRWVSRHMVLLFDFDGHPDRLQKAKEIIPESLSSRVFVLGALTEPEALKKHGSGFESIGVALADDCRDGTEYIWKHDLLKHNAGELERLRERVRPILF